MFNKREYQKKYHAEHKNENKEYMKNYYIKNKERIGECHKKYYAEHKDEIKKRSRQWYKDNPERAWGQCERWRKNNHEYAQKHNKKYYIENQEKILRRNKQWRKNNHEKIIKQKIQYRKNNPGKAREWSRRRRRNNLGETREYYRIRNKNKRKTDLKFKLNTNMAGAISTSLKGNKRGRHWEDLIGYTLNDLMKYLRKTTPKGYTWQDYLDGKLHIDHIIPISVFNFSKPEHIDFKRCWSLKNLRLLPVMENLKKYNKLEKPFQLALKI